MIFPDLHLFIKITKKSLLPISPKNESFFKWKNEDILKNIHCLNVNPDMIYSTWMFISDMVFPTTSTCPYSKSSNQSFKMTYLPQLKINSSKKYQWVSHIYSLENSSAYSYVKWAPIETSDWKTNKLFHRTKYNSINKEEQSHIFLEMSIRLKVLRS